MIKFVARARNGHRNKLLLVWLMAVVYSIFYFRVPSPLPKKSVGLALHCSCPRALATLDIG